MEEYYEPYITADEILSFLSKQNGSVPYSKGLKLIHLEHFEAALNRLKVDGFVHEDKSTSLIRLVLTKEGWILFRQGGFKTRLVVDFEDRNKAKIKEEREAEKLRIDLLNAKRVYKFFWWTFGFSVVALIVSLILLGLKLAE